MLMEGKCQKLNVQEWWHWGGGAPLDKRKASFGESKGRFGERAKLVLQNSQSCSEGPGKLGMCRPKLPISVQNPVTTSLQKKAAVLAKSWGWGTVLHVLRAGPVAILAHTPYLSSTLASCRLAPHPCFGNHPVICLPWPLFFSLLKCNLWFVPILGGWSPFKDQETLQHRVRLRTYPGLLLNKHWLWKKPLTVWFIYFLKEDKIEIRKQNLAAAEVHRLCCYGGRAGFLLILAFKGLCLMWLLDNHPTFDRVITK